ncbi:Potassium channel subfamily K member 9 [Echinococcus granulosus]|uniref:Potassium channel subfamily K member 9 n=1 Tax=Echinococcus granulosus TaxID=6210 RepID=U6J4X8_ECHGR|nr:Potassium channel subfamily K member 9 [Echinococcus granulosus]EUB62608.1 Potassium channel subfamily K member 9 [Echinococcus granulosus]KAH9279976.1 Potassium channel subfamily K member 9 [Echinococcus granulosus]CDS19136.1 Two pore potassium channel protein sup 9 [Echinococcus granulosus]
MKRQNVRTLALIVCTFTYLVLGAAVFDALESDMEGTEKERLHAQEREWQRRYNITAEDFEKITQLGIQLKPYRAGTQWKFAGAFYFATTVITTIGYGHCTPKTVGGKIFCMVYALPGIPLCLVMFQSIGERINTLITRLLRRIISLLNCKSRTVSQTHLIFVSANVVTIVLTAGAAVFAQYEKWHYLDAVYYCFITLTTIGFGDFVALQREDSLAKRPDYVAFSLIFILFGLTVVSSVMNLLVLRFLTMNTDDQRRDDLEAAAQAQELRRLHGDVIHSVIGMNNHQPPGRHDDTGPITSSIQCKEISHIKEVTSMKNQPARHSYGEDAIMNQFHPLETHQSAVMLHVEKYFRSFARLFSHESHQNPNPSTGNFLHNIEDRVSATASYTESEVYDEEYSPWVSQSKDKTGREHGQHIFRFTDSCYRNLQKLKEPKACIRAKNVGCKSEVENETMVVPQRNCEQETKSETYIDPNADDCESPPRKCFRYASFDRASC